MTPLEAYEAAREAVEAAYAAAETALAALVEHELAELAKRFPARRIEFHSGMGSSSLSIYYRKVAYDRTRSYSGFTYGNYGPNDWPEYVAIPCPELWDAFEDYQDTISDGKDPGLGTVIYENGKRLQGLLI